MKPITTVNELLEALVRFAGDIPLAEPVHLTLCTHKYLRSGVYTNPIEAGSVEDQEDLEEAIDDPLVKLEQPVLSIGIEHEPARASDLEAERQ